MTKLGLLVIVLCVLSLGLVAVAMIRAFILPLLPTSASPVRTVPTAVSVVPTKNVAKTGLAELVTKALAGSKGTYAVVVINLRTGESYRLNEERVFESASLYKLWVMATAFKQIEAGSLKRDEVLTDSIAQLNRDFDIASESAELTSGGISLTTKTALEQMITISHNYAAMLLSKRVKLSQVSAFLAAHNYTHSALGTPPKTTAADMAQFLADLYHGKLGSESSTHDMLALLKRQQLNNKLPLYLPPEVQMAHKTGELDRVTHDAGIVFSNQGDFIIVVLSESDSPVGAEERIAQISKVVYDYFLVK